MPSHICEAIFFSFGKFHLIWGLSDILTSIKYSNQYGFQFHVQKLPNNDEDEAIQLMVVNEAAKIPIGHQFATEIHLTAKRTEFRLSNEQIRNIIALAKNCNFASSVRNFHGIERQ